MGWSPKTWFRRAPAEDAVIGAEMVLARAALGGDEPADAIHKALNLLETAEAFGLPSAVLAKAKQVGKASKGKGLAHDLDPYDVMQAGDEALAGDAHLGTAGLSYGMLSQMARVPTVAAIIQTRVNQVASFAWPAEDDEDLGFKITLRDPTKTPTRAERRRAQEITDWLVSCGDESLGFEMNLEAFLRQTVRDSMIYDQMCFEVVRTRGNKLAGLVPVDATTIRRAVPSEEEHKRGIRDRGESTAFVQVVRDEVVAEWTAREMAFGVRRPRTRIAVRGYGYPELEDLIRVVTGILHGESYNAGNFTHGMHAAGVLALKSKMGKRLFRAFRRDFYAMMSGAHNARKTPIIQLDPDAKEELQSINFSQNNREMEFKEWMAYLQKMACANFQMDPAELGFIYGAEGQTGALSQGGPADRILASKEKGLHPLLRFVRVMLNRHVVSQLDPAFMLVWVGLDAEKRKARLDQDLQKLKGFMTVNEMRARYDLPKIKPEVDGGAADLVLDSTYMNTAIQMRQMAEQSEQQGEEPPEDGQEPVDDGQGQPQGGEEDQQGWDMGDDDVDLDALFGGPQDDDGEGELAKAVTVEVVRPTRKREQGS